MDPNFTAQSHIKQTWKRLTESPNEALSVDWPLLGHARFQKPVHYTAPVANDGRAVWLTLLAAMEELNGYADYDTLLRRAVELTRSITGIPRVALFLLSEDGARLSGTWGTSLAGESVAEQHVQFNAGDSHKEAFALAYTGLARWLVLRDVPLLEQSPSGPRIVASGENLLFPIRGSRRPLGLFACDAATATGCQPIADAQLIQAAVLSMHIGGLLERHRPRSTRASGGGSCAVGDAASNQSTSLAYRAAMHLRRDVSLSRSGLARQLGVCTSVLGKAFKAHMGRSLSDYRNQLRLERFLTLVEPDGGNILSAALDAGFGSYAQFHRVFSAKMGSSPKEYCTRKRAVGVGDGRPPVARGGS